MSDSTTIHLVYSYSHKDEEELHRIKEVLTPFRMNGVMEDWLDEDVLPGEHISKSVREKLEKADIVIFLLSQRFLASTPCMEEWHFVKSLSDKGSPIFRIPVVLSPCDWEQLLEEDDIKALPKDAIPISKMDDEDSAWQSVYDSIKPLFERIRNTCVPREDFLDSIEETDLLSHEDIKLSQIFIFPPLTAYDIQHQTRTQELEHRLPDIEDLAALKNVLIHGSDMSGKTALSRYFFLHLSSMGSAVLYIDLKDGIGSANEKSYRRMYENQFTGDYEIWKKRQYKTAVVDNLDSSPKSKQIVSNLSTFFERLVVFVATDTDTSFYRDDKAFAAFTEVRLGQLTHVQQEKLIRKRLTLTAKNGKIVTDGVVDEIEKKVDSVIYRRIVPRYPFYVLSIIQTFEAYMPSNLVVTSYGHCYQTLIIAKLMKAGVDPRDDDLNTCFNFAENLAFALYQYHNSDQAGNLSEFNYDGFVKEYRKTYLIRNSLLNRISNSEFGIISDQGKFKIPYMYYYFLGKYLSAANINDNLELIDDMCNKSYIRSNHLTLLFIIHHATDNRVIDTILDIAAETLKDIPAATLSTDETKRFSEIVNGLPESVLNDGDVEKERRRQRELKDETESEEVVENEEPDRSKVEEDVRNVNDCYRTLKNNEILGQILRSRYGRLRRDKINTIIETISDGGLRLVNLILKDEKEIEELADFVYERIGEDAKRTQIIRLIRFLSFNWTMVNIESIVRCVNSLNVKEELDKKVSSRDTAAYDLIGYFSELDSARELDESIRKRLRALIQRHQDPFLKSVLSLRTQHYMNTHRSKREIEQSFCDLLNIPQKRFLLHRGRSIS